MRIALDTNRYTDLARGDEAVADLVARASFVGLPFPVLGELRAGFALGKHGRHNDAALRRFMAQPGVEALHSTEQSVRHYARLFRQLRRQGTPVPSNELWIAAVALEHELALLTRDAHFEHFGQLELVQL